MSNAQIGGPRLMTMSDVASKCGISKASLSRASNGKLANCTKLPCVSIGRRRFVRPEALDEWLKENERR